MLIMNTKSIIEIQWILFQKDLSNRIRIKVSPKYKMFVKDNIIYLDKAL